MPTSKDRKARVTTSNPRPDGRPEDIDPKWLAKAIGLTILAAVVCAWLAVCLLVYQGEWQLVLHPSHTVGLTPASTGLGFTEVKFDSAESGQPRLTAWLVPAATGARYAAYTVLYLHGGSGSLSDTIPAVTRLHQAGLNVFALDYRGFGRSDASQHPSEARMAADSAAALEYLIAVLHVPASAIVPYGAGLGASLATSLAAAHPSLPVVILENPNPDADATAAAAHPDRIIPTRLLFHEHFEIAKRLATLKTPKLLIAGGPGSGNGSADLSAVQDLFRRARSPSFTVTLPPVDYDSEYQTALTRFLDQYVASAVPTLRLP